MNIDICERCEEKKPLEKYSYRVVCQEGTINLDVNYCSCLLYTSDAADE